MLSRFRAMAAMSGASVEGEGRCGIVRMGITQSRVTSVAIIKGS